MDQHNILMIRIFMSVNNLMILTILIQLNELLEYNPCHLPMFLLWFPPGIVLMVG